MPSAPPEPPSPITAAMIGTRSVIISRKIDRDRFRDVAFFRADPGIGARRIDQRNHGQIEFFREPHDAERLAIALRIGATEIALHVFLRVAALLLRDDDAAMRAESGQAARHRFVVAKDAIAVQLHPFGEAARRCSRARTGAARGGRFGRAARRSGCRKFRGAFRAALSSIDSTSESKSMSCLSECDLRSCSRRCNSRIGFSKSSGCESMVAIE